MNVESGIADDNLRPSVSVDVHVHRRGGYPVSSPNAPALALSLSLSQLAFFILLSLPILTASCLSRVSSFLPSLSLSWYFHHFMV